MKNVRGAVSWVGAIAILVIAVGAVMWWLSGGTTSDMQAAAPPPEPRAVDPVAAEGAAPAGDSVTQQIDEFLNNIQKSGTLFNGSVLVAHGDEIIFSKGYGLADAELGTPNTPQTRFPISTITQDFTTVAILQLQDQGRLTVDDPICRFLDPCPAAWEAVTINHLLTHSSGIRDYLYHGGPLSAGSTPEELVGRVIDTSLEIEPGSERVFSNTGFLLLGMIIERVARQPYLTYLQENIFAPLEMNDTGIDSGDSEVAVGRRLYSAKAEYVEASRYFATASLYSTVKDLYRFSQGLQTGQLLSPAARDLMFTPQDLPTGWSVGWFPSSANRGEGPLGGRRVSYVSGANASGRSFLDGYQSVMARYPDDDLTVIVLENLEASSPLSTVVRQVASMVLGDE